MRASAGIALGLLLAGLLATGCIGRGTYSLDFFQEMHYQPVYKSYEPPRLSSPEEAVPVTGKDAPLTLSYLDASDLRNPVPNTPRTMERAEMLYQVNCAMCHGQNADGQSFVADRFQEAGAIRPVDYNSDRIRSRNEGQLYWAISNPKGFGFMPSFGKLLSDEERWALVRFIQAKASGQ